MNASEKRLMILFGIALGCVAGYYIVDGVFIEPAKEARQHISEYTTKKNNMKMLIGSELNLAEQWQKYAERTFSFDKNQAFDWFGEALKEMAEANGFSAPEIKKKMSTKKLGRKTGIEAIHYEITVKSDFTKAMKLLRAMYATPYVSRVSDVAITPERMADDRNIVKLSFEVATLVLPKIPKKESIFFADVKTMPHEPEKRLKKWRHDFPPASAFALFKARNIFREYMPPPPNSVVVENRDPKLVGIDAKFYWDDEVASQSQIGVKPRQQENIVGKGNEVEILGVYADGTEFRQRHVFTDGKPWTYTVPSHTVEVPKTINLAIDSRDDAEARFTVKITGEDGKQKTLPEMVIGPTSKVSLGEFDAKQIMVSAVYPKTGRTVPERRFTPSPNEQVYLIPQHAEPPPTPDQPEQVVKSTDCEPASGYTVTGLLTYHDSFEDKDKQEMVVDGPDGRQIFEAGNPENRIDCGVLIAVCPLGGIVYMPDTRNYYLYPRGEGFEARAKLNADRPEQLAMAIQEWSQQN